MLILTLTSKLGRKNNYDIIGKKGLNQNKRTNKNPGEKIEEALTNFASNRQGRYHKDAIVLELE